MSDVPPIDPLMFRQVLPQVTQGMAMNTSRLGELHSVLVAIRHLSGQGIIQAVVSLHFDTTLTELERRGFFVEPHGPHFLISWLRPDIDLETHAPHRPA